MRCSPIDSDHFLSVVRPALEARDADRLARIVCHNWTTEQLCDLLRHGDPDARRIVCLTLGLVGCHGCVACLSLALHDEDPVVANLAENAMWSIWFRCTSAEAVDSFKAGLNHLERHEYQQAIDALTRTIEAADDFAEAYNQRSIALYMLDRFDEAIADAERAVELEPVHFGAIAGMGHCYAHLGDLAEAARCYRDCLAINPQLTAIAKALERIEERINIPA